MLHFLEFWKQGIVLFVVVQVMKRLVTAVLQYLASFQLLQRKTISYQLIYTVYKFTSTIMDIIIWMNLEMIDFVISLPHLVR